jgi:hypothetical protein
VSVQSLGKNRHKYDLSQIKKNNYSSKIKIIRIPKKTKYKSFSPTGFDHEFTMSNNLIKEITINIRS